MVMVKAVHCLALATKAPLSTERYRVLTVCERRRLNKATLEHEEIHTGTHTHTGRQGDTVMKKQTHTKTHSIAQRYRLDPL